jgi:hypothetical protein
LGDSKHILHFKIMQVFAFKNSWDNVIFKISALNKFKSLGFGESKHIFKFKIVQIFPAKNVFTFNAELTILKMVLDFLLYFRP